MIYETTTQISETTAEYLWTRGLPVEGEEVDIEVDFDVEPADRSVGIMSTNAIINQVMAVSPDGKTKIDVTDESWLPEDLVLRCCDFAESEEASAYDEEMDRRYERFKEERYFGGE